MPLSAGALRPLLGKEVNVFSPLASLAEDDDYLLQVGEGYLAAVEDDCLILTGQPGGEVEEVIALSCVAVVGVVKAEPPQLQALPGGKSASVHRLREPEPQGEPA